MINKDTYERLTSKTIGSFNYCLKDHKSKVGEFNDYDAFFAYSMAVKRLGELEDKIENGTLIELSCVRNVKSKESDTAQLAIQRFINQLHIDQIIRVDSDLGKELSKEKEFALKRYYGVEVQND